MQRLFQLHENPHLIQWAQTSGGRLAVWLAATLLLVPGNSSLLVPLFLGLVMIWPEGRQKIILIAAPFVALELVAGPIPQLVRAPEKLTELASTVPAVLLVLSYVTLSIVAARNFQRLPPLVRKYPLVTLHLLTWCLIITAWQVPPSGIDDTAWKVVTLVLNVLPFLLWRSCYILLSGQRGSAGNASLADHLFYALPVFGGTEVPYGKGFDYLRRYWAGDRDAFARAQLAGLKLLILYWLWTAARKVILAIAHGNYQGKLRVLEDYGIAEVVNLGIPRLKDLIAVSVSSTPALGEAWASLFLALILDVLGVAILGHIIVGSLRLFGFNVFRNTYKPLLAQSIVEFWNRYLYYFKELLVEFFFYPVYLRYFRSYHSLRIFAAVMAAACLGNTYFHVLRDFETLQVLSFEEALAALAPRAFYTFLLGTGIYLSMMAEQRRRGGARPNGPDRLQSVRRLGRIAGVWLFFALIGIWNTHVPAAQFGVRTAFFFSLFGISFGA